MRINGDRLILLMAIVLMLLIAAVSESDIKIGLDGINFVSSRPSLEA